MVDIVAPYVETRIVRYDRAGTCHHGAGSSTQPLYVIPRCIAGDPVTLAVRHRRLAIEARCSFQAHKWPAALHTGYEAGIE